MGIVRNWVRFAGGSLVRTRMRRDARRNLEAARDCRAAQRDVLQRLLRLNAESQFGRAHRLSEVRTVADLRQRIPITDYEYYRRYIDRMKLGEHAALLGPHNRLLMFSLSSGTTSESKYIPITEQFARDYRRGWQTWGILAFDSHPGMHRKNIVQLTSDHNRFRTPAGIPCGNISGLVAAMQRPIVRHMYSVPKGVAKITDPEARYYTALRLAVADRHVGMATTANPSTLIHLARLADAEKETLIRDIADGTLSDRFAIEPEVRRALPGIGRARRARARELERIVARSGHLYPRDFWPELEILAVWCGGSAAAYLSTLQRYYGEAALRDHGLHASEGRMTVPICDARSEGILEVNTHVFEFIPEDEHGQPHPTLLEPHELELDRRYFIVLTTSSGLYRYDICDVVRCVGFHGTTPVLEFLHKGAHFSNVTGEKLSESQVVAAVRKCVDHLRIQPEHFTVSPVFADPPFYQLFVEARDLHSEELARRLAESVDATLMELNCEYAEKRRSARLAPLKTVLLPDETWKRFIQHRQSRLGGSIEQYKHPCLVPDLDFSAAFLRDFARRPAVPSPHVLPLRGVGVRVRAG